MFDLTGLEQNVTPQSAAAALDVLAEILNKYESGLDNQQAYVYGKILPEVTDHFTKFANLIIKLFKLPSCKPTLLQFYLLCLHKSKLIAIFEISEHRNTDVVMAFFLTKLQKKADPKRQLWLMKALLFCSFNTRLSYYLWDLLAIDKNLGIEALLGLLAKRRLFFLQEAEAYERFIQGFATIKTWQLHDHSPPQLSQVWYQAAYDYGPEKYVVLKILNQLTKQWLKERGVIAKSKAAINQRGRQTILVVLELFQSSHAMYRCFVNAIRALRSHYKLIAISEANDIDDIAKGHFDEWVELKLHTPQDISKVVNQINALQVDACCFTSVGMKFWGVLLANLRLAPIQFTLAGHPISSCSEEMDYLLLEEEKYMPGIEATEQIAGLPSGNFGFVLPEHQRLELKVSNDTKFKIAVTGTAYKLSAQFLNVCCEIAARSEKKIEFHFFTASRGLEFHVLNQKIGSLFTDAIIYPSCHYSNYLNYVSQCQLALAPFPFGGTNSTVDCILVAVPEVALLCPNIGCADPYLLRKVGLEDCVVTSVEAYITKAVAFIHDDAQRLACKKTLENLGEDLGGVLASKDNGEPYRQVVQSIMKSYTSLKQENKPFLPYLTLV